VSFNDLQLIEPVLQALGKEGYTNPTPFRRNLSLSFYKKEICLVVHKQVLAKQLLLFFLYFN
jgi:superfamily II DNA/RNA helicase